ncbi:MAG TPA: hypothetical protein VKD22_06645, partial [Ramlibacter sp.]|nr:hypothetical protein [Ramlibacter sp.]
EAAPEPDKPKETAAEAEKPKEDEEAAAAEPEPEKPKPAEGAPEKPKQAEPEKQSAHVEKPAPEAAPQAVTTTASMSKYDDTLTDPACAPLRATCTPQPRRYTKGAAERGRTLYLTDGELAEQAARMAGKPIFLEHSGLRPADLKDKIPLGRVLNAWPQEKDLRATFSVASDTRRSRLVARGIRNRALPAVSLGEMHLIDPVTKKKISTDVLELSVVRKPDCEGADITEIEDANGRRVLTAASFAGTLNDDLLEALTSDFSPFLDTPTAAMMLTAASGSGAVEQKTIGECYLVVGDGTGTLKEAQQPERMDTTPLETQPPQQQPEAQQPAAEGQPKPTKDDTAEQLRQLRKDMAEMAVSNRCAESEATKAREDAAKAEEARKLEVERMKAAHAKEKKEMEDAQALKEMETGVIADVRNARETARGMLGKTRLFKNEADRADVEESVKMFDAMLEDAKRFLDKEHRDLVAREARSVDRLSKALTVRSTASAEADDAAEEQGDRKSDRERAFQKDLKEHEDKAKAKESDATGVKRAADGTPKQEAPARMSNLIEFSRMVKERRAQNQAVQTSSSAEEPTRQVLGDVPALLQVLTAAMYGRAESDTYALDETKKFNMAVEIGNVLAKLQEEGRLVSLASNDPTTAEQWIEREAQKAVNGWTDNMVLVDNQKQMKAAPLTAAPMAFKTMASAAREHMRAPAAKRQRRDIEAGL